MGYSLPLPATGQNLPSEKTSRRLVGVIVLSSLEEVWAYREERFYPSLGVWGASI